MNYIEVFAERESANDESYIFTERLFSDGDKINEGVLIALLEGSKAIVEVLSPSSGYIFYLQESGSVIEVGNPYAIISQKKSIDIKLYKKNTKLRSISTDKTLEVSSNAEKFTTKALKALGENDVDDNYFANMELVTESDVNLYLKYKNNAFSTEIDNSDEILNKDLKGIQRVAVIGAGTAAVMVYDVVNKRHDQTIVCFFDNYKSEDFSLAGINVVGLASAKNIHSEYKKDRFDAVVISPGLLPFRKKLFEELTNLKVPFTNIVHPSVEIGVNVSMGIGNVIFGGAMIGPMTKIGNNNFIATRCNFEHHNKIENHNTFGPSVTTSGSVSIGSCVVFGSGIFIEPKVKIGNNAIISSGSILQKDILDNFIVKTKVSTIIKKK
jgi:sugar O-acyltransferase (sialic acid O-acetyltransferase NeuD family)